MTLFGMPHRVQAPNSKPRSALVVALGAGADAILVNLTDHPHTTLIAHKPNNGVEFGAMTHADLVFLVATETDNLAAAKALGDQAHARGLLVTGILVTNKTANEAALKALRAGADMLIVATDPDYLSAMLDALGC